MKPSHTPTPWEVEGDCVFHVHPSGMGNSIVCDMRGILKERKKANTNFLLSAVNSYEKNQEIIRELLKQLKTCRDEMLADGWSHESLEDVDQAIAKAEGK